MRFFGPSTRLRRWSNDTVLQIQDGGRRRVGSQINVKNFDTNGHIVDETWWDYKVTYVHDQIANRK